MNITCSALPEALLESELFGHERGAFTGADRQKRGLLESADGGTVFLDEIGEMVPALQAKLLRFLEEKTFKRVGGAADLRVDVRVIAATNRNLEEEVRQGRFREDLYYRLNVLPIALPPLRERAEDIPLLVHFYVDAYNTEFRKRIRGVHARGDGAARRPTRWPGNIRELRNAVERAMLLAEGDELDRRRLPARGRRRRASAMRWSCPRAASTSRSSSGRWSSRRSSAAAGTRRSAATLLGLNRDQIRYRIEKFKLERPT